MRRPRKILASATKSNALNYSMVLWDQVVDVVDDYFRIEREQKRSSRCVHDAVGVAHAAVAEDVAIQSRRASFPFEEIGHVVRPQETTVGGIEGVDAPPGIGEIHRAVDD